MLLAGEHPNAAPSASDYPSETTDWNADPHLISTYAFLSKDEAASFAAQPQRYLTAQVHETTFNEVIGTRKLQLYSLGVVKDYMWFFQRNDVKARNEWSNYSNWEYTNHDPGVLQNAWKLLMAISREKSMGLPLSVGSAPHGDNDQLGIRSGWQIPREPTGRRRATVCGTVRSFCRLLGKMACIRTISACTHLLMISNQVGEWI